MNNDKISAGTEFLTKVLLITREHLTRAMVHVTELEAALSIERERTAELEALLKDKEASAKL